MPDALAKSSRRPGVSPRAVLIGAAFVVLYVALMLDAEIRGLGGLMGAAVLNVPVAVLLAVLAANLVLKRWRPTSTFRVGELLTIYCMVAMGCGAASNWQVGGGLPPVITYPFRFATPENRYQELLWPYLPVWLTVRDPKALDEFWSGEALAYTWNVLRVWAGPALWWASLMTAVMWVALCLNSIVRRRWMDEEKLPFPFVPVPVLMADEGLGLFRSKAWWIGLGAALGLGMWNAIANVTPSIPSIPMGIDFYPYVAHRFPWQALAHRCYVVGWMPMYLGLCYFVPLDLLPSLLVFELWIWVVYLASYYFGWTATIQGFPYIDQQTSGGLIALALAFFWLDRRYFLQVMKRSVGLRSALREEGREALSYRTAVFGTLLGLCYIWWFLAHAKVPTWVVLTLLALYFGIVMVLSRVRAQVGSPTTDLSAAMPNMILRTMVGPLALGGPALGMLNLLTPFLLGYQENNPIPLQLEALKMAEGGRMERRRIATALALVAPLAVLCCFWFYLQFGYRIGIGTAKAGTGPLWVGRAGAESTAALLRNPLPMDAGGTMAIGFGMAFTWLLLHLKLRFQWWPLHPIAFPVANAWGMHYLTLIFIAIWVFKSVAMRYGGLRAHRAALPFFLGLLVGDLTAYTLQVVMSRMLGTRI